MGTSQGSYVAEIWRLRVCRLQLSVEMLKLSILTASGSGWTMTNLCPLRNKLKVCFSNDKSKSYQEEAEKKSDLWLTQGSSNHLPNWFEGASPFQTLSISWFPQGDVKYVPCVYETSIQVCQLFKPRTRKLVVCFDLLPHFFVTGLKQPRFGFLTLIFCNLGRHAQPSCGQPRVASFKKNKIKIQHFLHTFPIQRCLFI